MSKTIQSLVRNVFRMLDLGIKRIHPSADSADCIRSNLDEQTTIINGYLKTLNSCSLPIFACGDTLE